MRANPISRPISRKREQGGSNRVVYPKISRFGTNQAKSRLKNKKIGAEDAQAVYGCRKSQAIINILLQIRDLNGTEETQERKGNVSGAEYFQPCVISLQTM